jgi:hypothetical protein
MQPRSTEFYSDAYAYAVGYRDGREGNNVELPALDLFIDQCGYYVQPSLGYFET